MLIAIASSLALATEPVPLGPPFDFTEHPELEQRSPDISLGAGDEFVVVWESDGQDGDGQGAFSRRFDRRGQALGSDTQVSQIATDHQRAARVSANSAGDFVVVWQRSDYYEWWWPDRGMFRATPVGRRFARDGTPLGDNFELGAGKENWPSVQLRDSGEFVITWSHRAVDFSVEQLGQRFDATGAATGGTFTVDSRPNAYGQEFASTSDIALRPGGGFVVAYDQRDYSSSSSSPSSDVEVRWRRFSEAGAEGPSVEVDHNGCGSPCSPRQERSAVAANRKGNFVVVWGYEDRWPRVPIQFQRYEADGSPLGTPQILTNNDRGAVDVASNSAGDFVMAYHTSLQAFDRVGVSQGSAQSVEAIAPRVMLDLGDSGHLVAVGEAGIQQYCWDTPAALSLTGNPFGHLRIVDLPEAADPTGLPSAKPGRPLTGAGVSLTPAGRRALVSVAQPKRRKLVLSSVEIGTGLETARLELGPEVRAVAGVGPVVTDEGGSALLATEDPLAGSVELSVLEVATLASGTTASVADARLVPFVPPQLLPDDTQALLSIEDTALDRGALRLVALATGLVGPPMELDPGEQFVRGIAPLLLSNGSEAVTATQEAGSGLVRVRRWDLTTGLVDWRLDFSPSESLVPGVGLVVTADGSTAVVATSGEPGRVHVIDLTTGIADSSVALTPSEHLVEDVEMTLTADESSVLLATQDAAGGHAVLRVVRLAPVTEQPRIDLTGNLVPGIGPVAAPQGSLALQATDGDRPRLHLIDTDAASIAQSYAANTVEYLERGVNVSITPDSAKAVWPTGSTDLGGAQARIVDLETPNLGSTIALGSLQDLVRDVDVRLTRCGFSAIASTAGRDAALPGQLTLVDLGDETATTLVVYDAGERPEESVGIVFLPSIVREDCNANLLRDADEISAGDSDDCNTNGIPDECEPDCDGNGTANECDISGGASDDCDADGIPDDCQPDCNANRVADTCDIASGSSPDACGGNDVPDECEGDCNANGTIDSCDIHTRLSTDCNADEIPDECQSGGDTDGDGIMDCRDNCVFAPNASQTDTDHDGKGDACDDDDDDDGVIDALDNCRTRPNADQANGDGDLEGDACDVCPAAFDPHTLDGDADGVGDACDCEAGDGQLWLRPSPVRELFLDHDVPSGETTLVWQVPDEPGATAVRYDTLRSLLTDDFDGAAVCLETAGSDLSATDGGTPAEGVLFHYLIRAVNDCPDGAGQGPLGDGLFGVPRTWRGCP